MSETAASRPLRVRPVRCAPAVPALRIATLATLAAVTLAAGCSEAGTQTLAPARTHYVAIVDRSTSITEAESASYRAMTTELIEGLTYGDRLDLFVAYADGRGAGTVKASREMPVARNPANPLQKEERALRSAKESLLRASSGVFAAPTTEWTDLVSSLRDAEEHFRGSRLEEKVLILLSDMLHCRPGDSVSCMDTATWAEGSATASSGEAVRAEALAGLDSACVWVFGADIESARDLAVRDFWSRFFDSVGADFSSRRYYHGGRGSLGRGCG